MILANALPEINTTIIESPFRLMTSSQILEFRSCVQFFQIRYYSILARFVMFSHPDRVNDSINTPLILQRDLKTRLLRYRHCKCFPRSKSTRPRWRHVVPYHVIYQIDCGLVSKQSQLEHAANQSKRYTFQRNHRCSH